MSIDLPAGGTLHPSALGKPYLAVALTLEPGILATLLACLPEPASNRGSGFSVTTVTPELMDAWGTHAEIN